jgi:ABC-type transporter Mla maintaining outer membrane lipid asymmetry ATPase subunit MlaF
VTDAGTPVLELSGVTKAYGGLRPLRLQALKVPQGGVVAIAGFDAPAAEMLVNLVTGATLPETGEVRVFGRPTSSITDADEWLATVDRFGIVSDRAVLLGELTAAQNLAMTLTLDIDPVPVDVRTAVERLAREVGLESDVLDRKVATLGAPDQLRVRLGRAVALDPAIVLLEHPTATLAPADVPAFAGAFVRLVQGRGLTVLAVTADAGFASAITRDAWSWKPADGSLVPLGAGAWSRVRRLFGA